MSSKIITGWREYVALPQLGINRIKAKMDTGARTSSLHALHVTPYTHQGEQRVTFFLFPDQHDDTIRIECNAAVVEQRSIRNSGGEEEIRYVIMTELCLGENTFPTEVTLADRTNMGFRMLIGRTAMTNLLVDPKKSFQLSLKEMCI
ncbi:MAG: ATP-dependent zinc protease family protein [Vibrio sp.]